jgi:hypothetical protein
MRSLEPAAVDAKLSWGSIRDHREGPSAQGDGREELGEIEQCSVAAIGLLRHHDGVAGMDPGLIEFIAPEGLRRFPAQHRSAGWAIAVPGLAG